MKNFPGIRHLVAIGITAEGISGQFIFDFIDQTVTIPVAVRCSGIFPAVIYPPQIYGAAGAVVMIDLNVIITFESTGRGDNPSLQLICPRDHAVVGTIDIIKGSQGKSSQL